MGGIGEEGSTHFRISALSFFKLATADSIREATERMIDRMTENRFQKVELVNHGFWFMSV